MDLFLFLAFTLITSYTTKMLVTLFNKLEKVRGTFCIWAFGGLFLAVSSLLLAFPSEGSCNSSYPILSTKHKHQPRHKGNIQGDIGSLAGILQCQPSRPSKAKPGKKFNKTQVRGPLSLREKLSSKSAIVLDGETGQALYSHALDRPGQPASTIKVLTGLIALEALEGGDLVYVSRRAAGMPRSKVYLRAGKSYRANDLINSVLVASANDASVALAEKIAGSEKAFAKLMTFKAGKLGAPKTVCKTSTGLTAKGQKSTVKDLANFFEAAMKNPEFAARMARTKVKTSFGKVLRNHNKALWRVPGSEGGKTGYTKAARQTYVGKFRRSEGELLVAIMGSESMWDDISLLVEYGFAEKRRQHAGANMYVPVNIQLAQVRRDLLNTKRNLQVLTESKKISKM